MAYWAAAQLQPNRIALALHLLAQGGFEIYAPRIRERRIVRGLREKVISPLFPGYVFVSIELQWHAARWTPGITRLVMDGLVPAKVPDAVIKEIRSRERNAKSFRYKVTDFALRGALFFTRTYNRLLRPGLAAALPALRAAATPARLQRAQRTNRRHDQTSPIPHAKT